MKTLILRNYYLIDSPAPRPITSLQVWLNNQMLHGKVSRHRTRFIKLIIGRAEEVEKEKLVMLEKHADKKKVKGEDVAIYLDEKGKDTTDAKDGKKFKLSTENEQKFLDEYNAYLNEDFVMDVTPANREDIYGVRDMVLNTEAEFSKIQATRYNEWCDAFEGISEEKKEEVKEEPKKEKKDDK